MPTMKRAVKDALKRLMFAAYRTGSRAGVSVLPAHYYAPQPDILELERTRRTWARRSSLRGIDVDLDRQAAALRRVCLPFREEYRGAATYRTASDQGFGPGYGLVEAQALHAVVRSYKPSRIVEVGSGVSTACALAAARLNAERDGRPGEITCVEPFPSSFLTDISKRGGDVRLIQSAVQSVPISVFEELQANDILFVDSSHVAKTASDVTHIFLEVLPALRAGVLVHVHDVYFPFEYQRDTLRTFLHANETAMLAAFLSFNSRYSILFCLSQLHYDRPDVLREVFPGYNRQPDEDGLSAGPTSLHEHFPSAIWLESRA